MKKLLKNKRVKKVLVAVGIVLLIAGGAAMLFILSDRNKSEDICKQMQSLDRSYLEVPEEYEKVDAATDSPISGTNSSYTLDSKVPSTTFTIKDSEGKEHTINTILITDENNSSATVTDNKVTWKKIYNSVDLEYQTFKDYVKETFFLESADSPTSFRFNIELSEGLILDDLRYGAGIMVVVEETGEELTLLRAPQGIDAEGQRIDYKLELNGNRLSLTPNRPWQLGCATYPIEVDPSISTTAWDEVLVNVGENCSGPGCAKDGDIIDIKPTGWNWGTEERKKFAILKIPRLTAEERFWYSSRTIDLQDDDDLDGQMTSEEWLNSLDEKTRARVSEHSAMSMFGIDYTNYTTQEELNLIRSKNDDSPVVNLTGNISKEEIGSLFRRKTDPLLSIIPEQSRLAYNADHPEKKTSLNDLLIPDAKAAGTIISTIGTGVGRDYSTPTAWETAQGGDLVTAQEIRIGEMYNDSTFFQTSETAIDGSTTSSSYYMKLTVASTDRHKGVEGTGVVIDCGMEDGDSGGDYGIRVQDNYTVVEWVEITRCGVGGTWAPLALSDSGSATDNVLFQNVIIHNFYDSSNNVIGIGWKSVSIGGSLTVRNALIYDGGFGIRGDSNNSAGGTTAIDNVTVYDMKSSRGIYEDDGDDGGGAESTFTVTNTISMDNANNDFEIQRGSCTNSISSDATAAAGDTNCVTCTNCVTNANSSDQFVRLSGNTLDLHLKVGSDAIDAGTTGSGFDYDIDNEDRPQFSAWDVGMDEYSNTDPVGYWKFDEGTDNTCKGGTNDACDTSGSANDGAISNGTAWQSGEFCIDDKCLFFDGTDDVVTVTNDTEIDFDLGLNTGVTFAAWVRVNSDGEANQGEIYDKGTTNYLRITNEGSDGLADLEASLDLGTADATKSIVNGITLNKWHHIAVAYTDDADDEISIYIDGHLVGTSGNGNGSPAGTDTSNLLIGGDSSNNFHGFIDDFKIYHYERSAAEIKSDYLGGAAGGAAASFGPDNSYLSDGLVGYWDMDQKTGTATDSSGLATSLTNNNTVIYTGGKFGNGGEFDGSSNYFEAVDNAYLSIQADLTLAAWIEPDDVSGSQDIVGKWDGTNNSYMLALSGDELRMYIDGSSDYETTDTANLAGNTIYHVAGVYDASKQQVQLFVNGALMESTTTGTIPSSIGDDAGEFVVGADDSPANYYDGHIDEVRVYNRAFTPSEVNSLYEWAPGPIAYWKFDEGQGTGTDAIKDSSGNGFDMDAYADDWGEGIYGNAMVWDTQGDRTELDDTAEAEFDLGVGNDITVTGWAYVDANQFHTLPTFWKKGAQANDVPGYNFRIDIDPGQMEVRWDNDTGGNRCNEQMNIGELIETDMWHYFTFIIDRTPTSDTAYVYYDGVLVNSSVCNNNINSDLDSSESMRIGYFNTDSSSWVGKFDDVKVYNYVRNAQQVVEDMNAGHPAPGSPVGSSVGHWKFDEGYGTTAYDTSDNGNDLTLSTASWTNSGKFGKAFNGLTNVRASITDTASGDNLDFAAGESFTFSLWFKSDSSTNPSANEYLLEKGGNIATDAIGYAVYTSAASDGLFCIGIDDDATSFPEDSVCTTNDYYDNTWHNLVAVKNANSRIDLYIDGVPNGPPDTSISATGTLANSATFYIGDTNGTDGTDEFLGDIDEVQVFRSALSASQVKLLYNQGFATTFGATSSNTSGAGSKDALSAYCPPGSTDSCTGPVGEWLLNENSGTSTTYDTSGNGNDGTLTSINESSWTPGKVGSALNLDGSADYVDIGTGPTSVKSVEFWVRPIGTTEYFVNLTSTTDYIWDNGGTGLTATGFSSPTYYINGVESQTITEGQWNHVVVTTASAENASNLDIGRTQNTNYLEGVIDQVRLFSNELTPAEVAWLYNRGAPIHHFKFDECQGNTIGDSGPYGLTGTYTVNSSASDSTYTTVGTCDSGTSTEGWNAGTTGVYNSALAMSNDAGDPDTYIDDFVTVNSSSGLPTLPTKDFTIAAWVYPTTDGAIFIAPDSSGTNELGLFLIDTGPALKFRVYVNGSNNTFNTDITGALNQWYHVVGTREGSTVKFYLNGVYDGEDSDSNTLAYTGCSVFYIGADADTNCTTLDQGANGMIDDLRIYSYALNEIQIRDLYNNRGFAASFGP